MDKSPRNPVWSKDELTLALDVYGETGGNPTAKDAPAPEALSGVLNKLQRVSGGGSGTLRNRNDVYITVMNFHAPDPAQLDQGKVGMHRGNRVEGVLWAEYDGQVADLATEAEGIRKAVIGVDGSALAKLPPAEPYEGEEGGVIVRLHKRYERDPTLVREKRRAAAAGGSLACEACGFDFGAVYGELGAGNIEVHHTRPVHTLVRSAKTNLAGLTLFCANCHRVAHRKRSPRSVEAVRSR